MHSIVIHAHFGPISILFSKFFNKIAFSVGMDVNFAIIPLSLLPAELQDLIFHLFQYFAQVPLPNCLTQIKTNLLIGDHNH